MDEFVNDAASLRITPFMLDSYRHEYEDLMVCPLALFVDQSMTLIVIPQRETNKNATLIDELRTTNRSLLNQV